MNTPVVGMLMWLSSQFANPQAANSVACGVSNHLSASAVLVKVLSNHPLDGWPGLSANVKREGEEFHVFFYRRPKQMGAGRYYVVDLCGNLKYKVPLP